MKFPHRLMKLIVLGGTVVTGAPAWAQDAPATPEATAAVAAIPTTGPDWWVFSRSTDRNYLIDINSIVRTGDEVSVKVARVPRQGDPQNYAHTEDVFGVRCTASETHVDQSMDVFEDGEPTEPYVTGEPWEAIRSGALDDGVKGIACDGDRLPGPSFPSVKAYIDAGRP